MNLHAMCSQATAAPRRSFSPEWDTINADAFSCSVEQPHPGGTPPGTGSAVSLADSAAGPQQLLVHCTVSMLAPAANEWRAPPTLPVDGFVRAAGTAFQLPDGSPFYFQVLQGFGVQQHAPCDASPALGRTHSSRVQVAVQRQWLSISAHYSLMSNTAQVLRCNLWCLGRVRTSTTC